MMHASGGLHDVAQNIIHYSRKKGYDRPRGKFYSFMFVLDDSLEVEIQKSFKHSDVKTDQKNPLHSQKETFKQISVLDCKMNAAPKSINHLLSVLITEYFCCIFKAISQQSFYYTGSTPFEHHIV